MSTYKNRKGHPLNLTPAELGERAATADASETVKLAEALQAARSVVFSLEEAVGIKERPAYYLSASEIKRRFAVEFKNAIDASNRLGDLLRVIRF